MTFPPRMAQDGLVEGSAHAIAVDGNTVVLFGITPVAGTAMADERPE